MPSTATCRIIRPGLVEYLTAWEMQKALAQRVADELEPNTLLLLEHPPVYTIGRRGDRDQVLLDDPQLSELGISLHEVDRGGQVTYHGPGQLVAYPIIDVRDWGGPVKYVRTLEQVIVKTLADFDIPAGLKEGLTGVWVPREQSEEEACSGGSRKIASIGVKISRGVTYHGFALNVNTDLSWFDHIIPCGVTDQGVISMERFLGGPVDMETVAYSLVYHFGREMGFPMVEAECLPEGPAAAQIPAQSA